MSFRGPASVAVASLLAGCALISGAADLEVGELPGATTDGAPAPLEDGAVSRPDAAVVDAPSEKQDAVVLPDGAVSTRVREVTFESGAVVGKDGADLASGAPTIETLLPISGKHSLRVDPGAYVEIDFDPRSEVYVTFLVRFDNIGLGVPAIARIGSSLLASVDLEFPDNHNTALQLRAGPVVLGPGGAVSDNGLVVYRMGLHLKPVGTQTAIEAFVAPRGTAFGTAVVAGSVNATGTIRYVRVGSVNDGNLKAIIDDILVDSGAMPAP